MSNLKGLENICNLKYHYVYKITNLISGKIYIGRHSTNCMNDGYFGSGKLIRRAVKKYGKKCFSIEIIKEFDTYKESCDYEAELVNVDFCNRSDTYNIVEGGSNPVMYRENNPAWKGGVSFILKGPFDFRGKNNPMFGRKHTKESIDKNKSSQKNSRKIYAEGVIYNSIRHCSREVNISRDGVRYRCNTDSFKDWYFL